MTTRSADISRDASPPPPRWLVKAMTRLHVFLNRVTGGRLFNSLRGDDVCFVTMKGAKSGRALTIPLMYVPYRDGVLLVASQGGAPRNRSPRQPGGEARTLADLRPALRSLRGLPQAHDPRHPHLRLRAGALRIASRDAAADTGGSSPTPSCSETMIRKLKDGRYRLYSRKKDPKTGKRRNLGTFKTRAAAEKHEREIQFFKRRR